MKSRKGNKVSFKKYTNQDHGIFDLTDTSYGPHTCLAELTTYMAIDQCNQQLPKIQKRGKNYPRKEMTFYLQRKQAAWHQKEKGLRTNSYFGRFELQVEERTSWPIWGTKHGVF